MNPRFREDKMTDMACRLLHLRGGSMSYMKLIKLMYLVEHSAILTWGSSVTFDHFVSMPRGPVMSRTLDLLTEEPQPRGDSVFHQHVSSPNSSFDVELLLVNHNYDSLSSAEVNLIGEVYSRYGSMSRWEIVEYTHKLREWDDPHGSCRPISIRRILERNEISRLETDAILDEISALAYAQDVLG